MLIVEIFGSALGLFGVIARSSLFARLRCFQGGHHSGRERRTATCSLVFTLVFYTCVCIRLPSFQRFQSQFSCLEAP